MSKNPQIFHGEWWVPAVADHDIKMTYLNPQGMMGHEHKFAGTLSYHEKEGTTLELYHYPSNLHAKHYGQNDVMWGKDANGNLFTLFNVVMKNDHVMDFSKIEFIVDLILVGGHILSLDEKWIKHCEIQFPYLRNWAFSNKISSSEIKLNEIMRNEKLLEVKLNVECFWSFWQSQSVERSVHDLTIQQMTKLVINATNTMSIRYFYRQIMEFSQFLSIALFCEQNPTEIKFFVKEYNRSCLLLFNKEVSANPGLSSLIKFDLLKDKLPAMLNQWHENFDKIAPISSYLIDSLQRKNRFDVPNFLIIAQALDGYHKRFVNKKDGRDVRKYEEQIDILLNQFKDVTAIQKCRINSMVLKDTRHKYSHLYPDEEESLAVEGEDLYWLTEKCKILLTCCILNMLGLTNKEINICCETQSPIKQIIDSLPPEWD